MGNNWHQRGGDSRSKPSQHSGIGHHQLVLSRSLHHLARLQPLHRSGGRHTMHWRRGQPAHHRRVRQHSHSNCSFQLCEHEPLARLSPRMAPGVYARHALFDVDPKQLRRCYSQWIRLNLSAALYFWKFINMEGFSLQIN